MKKISIVTSTILFSTALLAVEIESGWNLIGADSNVNIENSFNSHPEISIVWGFDNFNKNWSAYSSDSAVAQNIIDAGVSTLTSTTNGSGLWVYSNSYISSVDLDNSSSGVFDGIDIGRCNYDNCIGFDYSSQSIYQKSEQDVNWTFVVKPFDDTKRVNYFSEYSDIEIIDSTKALVSVEVYDSTKYGGEIKLISIDKSSGSYNTTIETTFGDKWSRFYRKKDDNSTIIAYINSEDKSSIYESSDFGVTWNVTNLDERLTYYISSYENGFYYLKNFFTYNHYNGNFQIYNSSFTPIFSTPNKEYDRGAMHYNSNLAILYSDYWRKPSSKIEIFDLNTTTSLFTKDFGEMVRYVNLNSDIIYVVTHNDRGENVNIYQSNISNINSSWELNSTIPNVEFKISYFDSYSNKLHIYDYDNNSTRVDGYYEFDGISWNFTRNSYRPNLNSKKEPFITYQIGENEFETIENR